MPTWTSPTLPKLGLVDGFDEQDDNAIIEFSTEKGPSKRRKVISDPGELVQAQTPPMTKTVKEAVESFYRTDLGRGSLTFTMNHPISGASKTWRMEAPPQIRLIGIHFVAQLQLRIMP